MAEFVPLLKRIAEINTRLSSGFKAIEERYPVDMYTPHPDRFKPVNLFRDPKTREVLNFSWADLVIAEEGAQHGTAYSRWIAKVRAAGYDNK